ncbi:complement C3-like [Carassius carassius]|uniref:complement C3-like n=1 Tax=Carassius carassius TaxID=217509 RepID=UPI0028689AFF|nr:complement C3-like [Carassius carassius]
MRESRCLVLITVGLLLIRVLLLVFIILQHITITAERDLMKSYKNTVKELNQTIKSLQDNYTDLMIEKDQLQNIFNFVIQKKLELETTISFPLLMQQRAGLTADSTARIMVVICYILSAPNILKVGSPEKVFLEAQDYSGASLNVKVSVRNPKDNNREVTSESVTLTSAKNYQDLVEIEIPGNVFSFEKEVQQYAILQAQFPQKLLEKKVMVIFQSGNIVLQTDKTIYTPDSTVYYRVFSLSPGMTRPVESRVRVEILTPDGISLESKSVYPGGGIVSGTFSLTDPASPGLWKLVAWHQNSPQKNFSSEFEVKEYVLPSFEVTLSPQKAFFYVNDDSLSFDIKAKYLFGEKVSGHGFVVFGVVTEDKGKISIPGSLQRVQIWEGSGTAELKRKHILQTFPNIMQLVGQSLYIAVSVLTESGSEMVEAQKKGIQIVTSPYTIHFKKTPHFFKPGMPFDVSVYITNPDQTPAKNVKVEVNPGGVRGQTRDNGIAKVTVNTPGGSSTLEIIVKTKDPQLTDEQQAVKKMTAQAYKPKGGSNNYLHIGIDAAALQIGDQMKVSLNLGKSSRVIDQDFTYMILSKGQIIQADRFKRRGQSLVSLSLPVTKDMVPSFRFVAYYHVGSSEVVSDSVWVDVKDTCMGTLKVEVYDPVDMYEPGEDFSLSITGDPGAKVGLVAVDKGVYVLNNKNRITQTKIWDVVESHDIGCTAGSGKDSMQVFSDAGLLFESSSAGGTDVRTNPQCQSSPRRKRRDITSMDLLRSLSNKYSGIERECCLDGLKNIEDLSITCQYRASFIVDGEECRQAFLHCCNVMADHREKSVEEQILARSESEEFVNSDDIGNVHGQNSQASMTAFVLIALQEGRGICAGQISSLERSINKAVVYLRSQFHGLTNPYAVAMTSYALANGNALDKQILLRKASADGSHYPVPGSNSFTLEASAYALLALVKAQDFQSAAPIVNWLNNQRQYNGGYGTTQATIMVFQAVAEYRIQVKEIRQLDLEMTIRVDGSRQPIVWKFNKDNSYLAQTEKISSNRQITISAKGSGEASVTVVTEYYAKPKESKTTCKNFELSLAFEKANKVTYQGATESYKLIINTRYLSADRDATMSILDISLLTGFVVDENDLKTLSTGHDRMIQKFEMNKQLSERGSLILYLDKISRTREDRISFRLHRIMNGGFLQPAAVTVYEYYSLENRCVRFYHPTRKEGAVQKICKNDVCQCAEENCSLQKKEKILEAHRNKKACDPKINYVYKAVILREREDALTVYYDVRIELALKTGPEINVEGEERTFSLQISCKEALNLKRGESYLIMGQADDVQIVGRIGQYALGERTWLEFWPSLEESKTSAELKEKYNGMLSIQQDLRFGCSK